ncbi:MAG: lysylphosphatidylglycerol synthase domain-containing protein [Alphaproteobacteria bacterium]|nr:lysylphosphatidylglycerol synthase domain-containing protein [Alphaproteobacteria bacterium]
MKKLSIALAILGMLTGTLLVGWFGFDRIVGAVISVGWNGFGLLMACQLGLFVVLGLAWDKIATKHGGVLTWVFVWGRMVRDAATNCLPFSSFGGFVLGARAVTLHGVPWPLATASVVVDATAEVLAQMVFAFVGLLIVITRDPSSPVAIPFAVGIGLAVAATAGLVSVQLGAGTIFASLGRRIAGRWFDDANERVIVFQDEVNLIYGRTRRLAIGSTLHFAAWIGTAFGSWIAYRLLGMALDFEDAVAIEAMVRVVTAAAFLVPGNAGVQEAGYAGFGLLYGVPPDISLGVSLLGRGRDFVLGVPILLIWQLVEVRRLRIAPPAE